MSLKITQDLQAAKAAVQKLPGHIRAITAITAIALIVSLIALGVAIGGRRGN